MYDRLLDSFIAVVNSGSFTKAADTLYVSPTGIMKQINALETRLGIKLLVRTSSGVKPTPAGEKIGSS